MTKIIISDPSTQRSYEYNIEKIDVLLGTKIGDTIDGSIIGLKGYKLKITGGSDKDGFPMRRDIPGTGRKRILISKGPGYNPKEKGIRRRKTVRGNTISDAIVQINAKVVEHGKKPLDELMGGDKDSKE
ncbi:MAG: 30S ribosomal protein S6e [Candidatus Hydrothermarchaeota archaeon]